LRQARVIAHVSRGLLAALFIASGVNHFVSPATYVAIMPPFLPAAAALVWISGVAEIAGGLGIVLKATRRIAGWGLIALLIAVFPANIYAALHGMEISGGPVPEWMLWARLPLQAVLVAWVMHAMRTTPDTQRSWN